MAWRGSAARKSNVAPSQRVYASSRFSTAAAAKTFNDNLLIIKKILRLLRAEGVRATHVSMEGVKVIFGLHVTDQSPSFNNDEPSSAKGNAELNKDKTDLNGYHKNRESAKHPRPRQEPPAMKPIRMGGVVMSRTCFKKMLRPLRNAFVTLFLKCKRWRVLQAKRAAFSLPPATVNGDNDTLMAELDGVAAVPLHAEQAPAKAPMHEDVTTVHKKKLKIALSAWEAMLLRDMKVLRPELRELLEESLLRRLPLGNEGDNERWEFGLLRLMAASIPRPQWELLLNALLRRRDINHPPCKAPGYLWKAFQPDKADIYNLQDWRLHCSTGVL